MKILFNQDGTLYLNVDGWFWTLERGGKVNRYDPLCLYWGYVRFAQIIGHPEKSNF